MSIPGAPTPTDAGRVPTLWPFSRDSVWNLPIGAAAVYIPGNIPPPTSRGMTVDPDVLILTPNAPITPVWYNNDGWGGGTRCNPEGNTLFSAPIPADFVVPGASGGDTPNFATAILMADNHTLKQGQPMARCTADGPATMWWYTTNDLYGMGQFGGHGGSMLSSIGGTIRLGELVPGGVIHHGLKVNLYAAVNLYYDGVTKGYRWPAKQADGCAPGCYGGNNPALRMGSLLALPPSVDVATMGLETDAAKILAQTFQDYGAYVVDDTAWSVYGIATEFSPQGRIEDEFLATWGYEINPASRNVPWARDMDRIFGSLNVIDNWNLATWQIVSLSNGTLGSGLGSPRVPWAPEFGQTAADTTPPVATASLSGTAGAADWYLSSVDATISATDSGSGVATILARTDGGTWQLYSTPLIIQGDGAHTVDYYATDFAGNVGITHSVSFHIDTVPPATASQVSGTIAGDGSYVSPVQIAFSSSDTTSGVYSIEYRLDGGAWWTYAQPFPLAGNGTHLLEYHANDVAGNSEAMHQRTIRITGSTHVPPISVFSAAGTAGANGWYTSSVKVTLSVTGQPGSTISIAYSLDGGSWANYAGPLTLGEGRHVVAYQASDTDGYVEPAKSATFNVDYTPPTIVRTAPTGDVMPPNGTLSWAGTDAVSGIAGYEVSIDGASFQALGSQTHVTRPWTVGTHVAVVKAKDTAGNEATSTVHFRVDPAATGNPTQPLETAPTGTLFVAVGLILLAVAFLSLPKKKGRRRSGGRERAPREVIPPPPEPAMVAIGEFAAQEENTSGDEAGRNASRDLPPPPPA